MKHILCLDLHFYPTQKRYKWSNNQNLFHWWNNVITIN